MSGSEDLIIQQALITADRLHETAVRKSAHEPGDSVICKLLDGAAAIRKLVELLDQTKSRSR